MRPDAEASEQKLSARSSPASTDSAGSAYLHLIHPHEIRYLKHEGRMQPRKKPKLRTDVCKPCWELKYCPYGPMVEHFPFASSPDYDIKARYQEVLGELASGLHKGEAEILSAVDVLLYHYPPRWEFIGQFDAVEHECNIFGHVCPVFFSAEGFTETISGRRHSRHVPRDIMLKVIRRDSRVCQICGGNVRDDEVAFDHVIPHSRGGPMTVENLRLVHRACSQKKRDYMDEILWEPDRREKIRRAPPDPEDDDPGL